MIDFFVLKYHICLSFFLVFISLSLVNVDSFKLVSAFSCLNSS